MSRYIKAIFGKYDHYWTTPNYHPAATSGLTLYKVANDLHIGSKYQDNPFIEDQIESLRNDGRTVFNGDIYDLSCCPEKLAPYLRQKQHELIAEFGEHFRWGNHCRLGIQTDLCILTTKAGKRYGFEHGDLFGKNKQKWTDYRLKEKLGAGRVKMLITSVFDDLDHIKANRPLPKGFIEDAYEWCVSHATDGVVLGHFHVETERRYFYKGKTIIILPAHKINEVWL